jgi:hypothetical protein
MKRILLVSGLLVGAVLAFFTFSCGRVKTSVTPQDYRGDWTSAALESTGNGDYEWRTFMISDTTWEERYTLFLDSAKTMPVYTLRTDGTYSLTGPSNTVKGADNITLRLSGKFLTLRTDDEVVIARYNLGDCGLKPGVELDISEYGCVWMRPLSLFNAVYTIVKRDGNTLYFGAENDSLFIETNRPNSLGPSLTKVTGMTADTGGTPTSVDSPGVTK